MIARKYRYLIALARERHFGRAAAACHVSPSTLSAAIRDIETELGAALVERGKQFVGLTAEGKCVVEHVQRMLASAEGLRQDLGKFRDGLTGRLRIGVIPTALTMVASLTAAFTKQHPFVQIQVLSLSTFEILERLQRFEIEAGIVYVESGERSQLPTYPIWQENHVLLCPEGWAVASWEQIGWREVLGLPLCLLTQDMQNRKTIDGVFASMGYVANPGVETNSVVSMLAHVCSGAWCAILPHGLLEQIGVPAHVRIIPLVEPSVSWATGIVVSPREHRPAMVEALLATVQEISPVFGKTE